MKLKTDIMLIIAVIFIAIIGGVSASDYNQTDDVVSVIDDGSLVDVQTTEYTDDSVKINESSDIEGGSFDTNDELAETNVKNAVSVSNSKSNEVLGASNNNEILGATLASLQTVIDNAGDTLDLQEDYTVGSDSRDFGYTTISKNIVINGNNHVLDAGERGMIIYIPGEYTITFNDLTFQNAVYSSTTDTRYYGGAVYVTGKATLIFNNCTFFNNKRFSGSNLGYGGAISSTGGGTFTFNDCDFIQNSAYTSGGAIYSYNGGSFTLNNCNFVENSAPNNGGAIYDRGTGSSRASYTITNCNFTGNTAGSVAPIYLYPSELSISGCNFINNTGYQEGCLFIYNSLTPVTISNSNFTGNTATSTEEGVVGRGGAIRLNVIDDVTVDNCYFEGNRAMYGGAIYSPYQPDGSQIINSQFIDNIATANGGAIYWNANSTEFRNNKFERNGAQDGAGIFIGFSVLGTVVDNCTFNNNEAISLGGAIKFINDNDNIKIVNTDFNDNFAQYGGSISFGPSSDNIEIDDCSFIENDATEYGGAIYFDGSSESIKITDSIFDKNYGSSGGAIHFYSGINVESYKDIDIINCNFTLNDCTSADARYGGSAIGFNWANDINLDNCNFIANNASANGAVMFDYCYDISFNECNFTDNYAGRYAGAIYFFNEFQGSNATFVKCIFNNNSAGRSGGAIATTLFSVYYENLGNIYENWRISDCEFTNNSALLSGGAAYLPWISYATLENLIFDNNIAGDSGALYMSGDTISASDITFTNNEATNLDAGALFIGVGSDTESHSTFDSLIFENNTAYGNGGAISGTASNVDITNGDFTNNSAWYGGAIFWNGGSNVNIINDNFLYNSANNAGAIDIYNTANVKIEGSSFINNTATVDAGAVWFNSNGGIITGCEFINNTAGEDGAAIIMDSSRQTVTLSTFTSNTAGSKGGAIYDTGVGADNSNSISESTFTSNNAYDGGAVYVTDGRVTQIYNDIFMDNIASHNGGAAYILVDAKPYVDYDLFAGDGIYRTTDERVTWNVGSRQVIYSSLFQKTNIDYYMNVTATVSGLTAVITVTVPADASKSRNGKVVFDITYTNQTGSYQTQYVLDNFEDDPGTITLNLPSSEVGHYDVIIGFSEDTYLYKQFNVSYNVTDPRGDFEILQGLINDAILNHFTELNLTRSYTFTPGNETNPLDFNVYDIEINGPLTINGNGWTINALGYSRIFAINGNDVVLKDLNIINGANDTDGGAILWSGSNGIVTNTEFTNNTATGNGGAIYYAPTAEDCQVINCIFENNTAGEDGGAIDWNATRGILNDTTFINNHADKYGGALCREANSDGGYGYNNIFIANTADEVGGAIAWMKAANIKITNYDFINNTAGYSGGAIYVGEGSGNCIVSESYFEGNNVTSDTDGHGGAIEWYAKEGAIHDSTFIRNNAFDGGAVFVGQSSGDINITNSVFTNNTAIANGGAIDANASAVILSNSELNYNTAQYGGAVYVGASGERNSISYCTFTHNDATYNGGAVDWAASNGNILESTFEYNTAENGGAVFIGGLSAGGSIINSTFNHNHADENGGAVDWNATIGRLTGSTFFNNTAKFGGATYRGANSTGGFGYDNVYISNHAEIDGGAIDWNAAGGNITDSVFYNNTAGRNGGAVYVGAVGATAYISDAIFVNNAAGENGGAVDWAASNGHIVRTTFEYNTAENGGAVFVGGSAEGGSVINSTFNHNHANEKGGALDWNSTIGKLINSTFYNNTAKYGGATYRGANSTGGYGYNNKYYSNHAEIDGGAIDWNSAGGNITNSEFKNNTAGRNGGAVYIGAQGSTTYVTDALFENNTAGGNGGAIDLVASNAHILKSTFNYNTAENGGAVFVGGTSGNGTIINSTFNYNHADENGGAIDWNSTIGKLSGSNFTFNTAKYGGATFRGTNATGGYGYNNIYISNYAEINGGAIHLNATGGNITESKFYNNTAGENGGAIFIGAQGSTAYVSNAIFESNKAGNRGGAIDLFASNGHVWDSNFTSNAADYGGAIFAGNNAEVSEITNSRFTRNTATYNGGAVDWNASSGKITDSSFDENTAQYGGAVFVGASTDHGHIINSNFTKNIASIRGGAVDWNASSGYVNDSRFEQNEAIDGGAIYVGSGASNGHIYNSTFISNKADADVGRGGAILFHTVDNIYLAKSNFTLNSADHGGAVYIEVCDNADIEETEFISNSANNDGAMHWEGKNGILKDSKFISNTATQDAGAIGWKGLDSDIYNVTFEKNTAGGKAGAIYWANVTNDEIHNVTFIENQAFQGGAIYWMAGNGTIYDAKFISNVAFENGGAIVMDNLSGNAIHNSSFTSNKATGYFNPEGIEYGDGGALYIINSDNMEVNNVTFDKNTAALKGGAMFITASDDSVLHDLTFTDNSANKVGGTIYWNSSSNATVHDILIDGSTAHDEGGAIYLKDIEATLENIAIDKSTSNYASGGAIYANGNVTINNATLTNFKSLSDVASAILFDGGNSSIANSTLTGNNAIVINEDTTVYVTENTINDAPEDGYAVLNGGTLYLKENDFDDVIINAGIIKTQTYTIVLGNKTVNTTEGSNVELNASIVDDTKNNDIVAIDTFKFHDITSGIYIDSTYSDRLTIGTYESVKQGKYIISANDVGLTNNTILTGTILVKASNNIEFNITQINEGENVTIKVELLPHDDNYPYEGNVSVTVNGKPYDIEIINGTGTLTLTNLTAGTYKVTAEYAGDEYHNNATNETYFVVNLRQTLISIAVNSILYGQNATAVVTTNANGTVKILLNGNKEVIIVNGTAVLNLTGLAPGNYSATVIYPGNEYYSMNYNETTFEVYKNNAVIDSIDFEKVVPAGKNNEITVTMGNVTDGIINIEVNGVNYTAQIVNKVAKLNVTLPVGKDYAVNAYFVGNDYFNATSMVGGTFDVTGKNVTVINITVESVVVIGDELIVTVETNTNATLNVTVNGKEVTLDADGKFTADTTTVGTYTIVARADENEYYSNGFNSTAFTVIKHNSTVDITVDPLHDAGDTFTIIVESNTTVTVTINGKDYEIDADGAVIIDTTALDAGEYIVTATVTENDEYYGNTSTKVFNIVKLASKVNVTAESVVYGNDVEIVVKVPTEQTGYVTISVNGQNITAEIKGGEAKFTISALNVDDYTVNVTYLGDGKYNSSVNSTTFKVTKANLTATVIAQNITVLQNETFTIAVDSNFKGNMTITVDDVTYDGGVELLVDMGKLTAGDKTATVTFYGDDNYDDLTMDVNFTVSKLDSPVNVVDDGKGTVTVIVPENATGNVTITVDGKTFNGTIENGSAVISLDNVSSGEYNITVTYPGDDTYKNATLNTTIKINKLSTPISVNVTNIYVGDVETIVVSLPVDATGDVTISVDGKLYVQPIIDGNATFTLTDLTYGNKTVAVSYIGDAEYDGNFTSANFIVSKRESFVNIDVEATNVGETVTINVEIPANATGIVLINVDGTEYSVNTDGGKGKLEFVGVGNATHTVKVTYFGDGQYLNSTNETTYGLSKLESTITVEAESIYKGAVATLIIKVTSGATGNVTIKIGDEYENIVGVTDGTITVLVSDLTVGQKTVEVTYNGNERYLPSTNDTSFSVLIKDAMILSDNVTAYYNQTEFAVRLVDHDNNPIAGETIVFTIDGQTYTATTDEYGDAKITLELPLGKHDIETSFTDALGKLIKVNNTIEMISSIRASNLTRGWNSPYDYMAVFLDGDGHVLVNENVSFIVNGKTYNVKTDAKGIALLNTSKLAIGEYEITLVNNVTGEKTTRTTTIVARIIENNDITMDFVDGTSYVVRVIGDDGKPVGAGEIIDMYANTIHYVGHTDENGYARLKINLNPKTYKLTAEYKQYKVANNLVVKQTLKLVKKTVKVKKGKKFKLKAKLKWSNGKAIKGKKIVFKFKGKKYSAKTNSKGIAKVKIKKKVAKKLKKGKKYKYSATYITNTVKGKVKVK